MIKLTRLNGQAFVMNAELVKTVESTPDTVVTLTTGDRYMVKEELDEVVRRVILYKRQTRVFPE